MSFNKKTVRNIDVEGKTVLMRASLNVPIDNGQVGDGLRLEAILPTLQFLLDKNARVILISHHSHEGVSLAPVAPSLAELLNRPVKFAADCVGNIAQTAAKTLNPKEVLVLENLRFHPEEEANDPGFAKQLAQLGEVYVNDDFTSVHRAHASIVGIPKFLPAVAGFQVEHEVDTISKAMDSPAK